MLLTITDPLHNVRLNFDDSLVWIMNLCIAIIMFSVALSMKREDFQALVKSPKQVLIGIASQFFLLPFVTFLIVLYIQPYAGLALGMILVASVPGGNVSNYFTLVGKGNPALSVTMTAISTLAAPLLTPLNFNFWGGNIAYVNELFTKINLNFFEMFKSVLLMLFIPMVLGLLFAKYFPVLNNRIKDYMQHLALIILIGFIIVAFSGNYNLFIEYYDEFVYLVLFHNIIAFGAGYLWGYVFSKNKTVARTICIETGIQNSGLALVLIFSLFNGEGGMALIAAWWGVYDIFAGLVVAYLFRYISKLRAQKKLLVKS